MSGLAHYLEEEGLATATISLIRLHAEKVRPPRSLWVPFELGRPLGFVNDPERQRQVLKRVLGLLEREDGPVILEDYDVKAPEDPDEVWVRPCESFEARTIETADLLAAVEKEMATLKPAYDKAMKKFGRTTVGASGLDVIDIPAFFASWIAGNPAPGPAGGIPAPWILRFAADDLKAWYQEAATAESTRPNSTQLLEWLFKETAAAQQLIALRATLTATDDRFSKIVGGGLLMPGEVALMLKL